MNYIKCKIAFILVFGVFLVACDRAQDEVKKTESDENLSKYHHTYDKLDSTAKSVFSDASLFTYNQAVLDSRNGNQQGALEKFEQLFADYQVARDEQLFSIVDVRYQSVVRPTLEFKRAGIIYQKMINQFGSLDYIVAASGFNEVLMLKSMLVQDVDHLIRSDRYFAVDTTYKSTLESVFKILFVEGASRYKTKLPSAHGSSSQKKLNINDTYLIQMVSRKYATKLEENASDTNNIIVLDTAISDVISHPNNAFKMTQLFSKISSVHDLIYVRERLSVYSEANGLGMLASFIGVIEGYVSNFDAILNETETLFKRNPQSEYIATTVSFLKYFSPFDTVQNAKSILNTYVGNATGVSEKASVSHHLGMITDWSESKDSNELLRSEKVLNCSCGISIGFISWGVSYEC